MRIDLQMPTSTHSEAPLAGFGGKAPNGEELSVNARWLSRNGAPWVPVMGEFHFSRFPRANWAESLGKIRAGGVQVVATYLFWIHHEEREGHFRWDGDRDVGAFVRACAEQGLQVVLRIGPWAHGECRNGGFPDWLREKDFPIRGNDPQYLALVRRFYEAIYGQVRGLMFKDGGPVVGIQLENEFGHCGGLHGEEGYRHIRLLKAMAVEAGFAVPLYTTTAWGGGIVVDGETLPVLGGYADAPWAQHVEPLPPSDTFVFKPLVAETDIGTDLSADAVQAFTCDMSAYPFLTAELGGGLQVTHHRRPLVDARDVEAMALVKLGCGANLLGYYMYHGGTNPVGECSTLQESRITGYANDLPEWSYDFQAPLDEYGQPNASWRHLRRLHLFLADYGHLLAPMPSLLPQGNCEDPVNPEGLRVAIRGRDGGGFVFLNRHQRGLRMTDLADLRISVDGVGKAESPVQFPPASLREGHACIWPFGMDLDGVRLESATAQPLCRLEGPEAVTHVFFAQEGVGASIRFGDGTVLDAAPGAREKVRFPAEDGRPKAVEVLLLTAADAEHAAKLHIGDRDVLAVTEGVLVQEAEGQVSLTTFSPDSVVMLYSAGGEADIVRTVCADGMAAATPCRVNGQTALRVRFAPASGTVETAGIARVGMRTPEMDARKAVWETNAYPPEVPCHLAVSVNVQAPAGPGVHNWFVELEPACDAARLRVNQKVCGDWFYTGNPWRIGLYRHFAPEMLDKGKASLLLELDPLRRTDAVYLEKTPAFHDGEACSPGAMRLLPQYRCMLELA